MPATKVRPGDRVAPEDGTPDDTWDPSAVGPNDIRPGNTAMQRSGKLSMPFQQLIKEGFLDGRYTFLDYGCGLGSDVAAAEQLGLVAQGWDPNHRPGTPQRADIVQLCYVINVIPDLKQRRDALRNAWRLADVMLSVAARTDRTSPVDPKPYGDGVLLKKAGAWTFQHFYTNAELQQYCQQVTGRQPHYVANGVFFIFKDSAAEAEWLAAR